jgi:hypothetical protein
MDCYADPRITDTDGVNCSEMPEQCARAVRAYT